MLTHFSFQPSIHPHILKYEVPVLPYGSTSPKIPRLIWLNKTPNALLIVEQMEIKIEMAREQP